MSVVASGVSRLKEARTKARAKVRSIDAEIVALQEKRAGLLETEARLDEEVDLITAGSTEKLHAAARAMDMAEMAAALDMGADIDRPGIGVSLDGLTKHTALQWAAANGDLGMGSLLLDRGADPNITMADGASPLFIASERNRTEIATLLLDRGADPNKAMPTDGATPLLVASLANNSGMATLLLDRGADPNKAMTHALATPLFMASQENHHEVATLLLDRGADLNKVDSKGRTPLLMASAENHREFLRLLLNRGADPNIAMPCGTTPLFTASLHGHLESLQLLATFGANLAVKTNRGTTAMAIAIRLGHTTVTDFLQAVAAWQPLKIAVACRFHAAAKTALKLGLVDPAFTTAAELATTASSPAGALWPGSPAVCGLTTALAKAAAMPAWSLGRHFMHHAGVRISIHTMLRIFERLRRRHRAHGGGTRRSIRQLQQDGSAAAGHESVLPVLPSELWLLICSFVLRSHWEVPR